MRRSRAAGKSNRPGALRRTKTPKPIIPTGARQGTGTTRPPASTAPQKQRRRASPGSPQLTLASAPAEARRPSGTAAAPADAPADARRQSPRRERAPCSSRPQETASTPHATPRPTRSSIHPPSRSPSQSWGAPPNAPQRRRSGAAPPPRPVPEIDPAPRVRTSAYNHRLGALPLSLPSAATRPRRGANASFLLHGIVPTKWTAPARSIRRRSPRPPPSPPPSLLLVLLLLGQGTATPTTSRCRPAM